MRVLRALTTVAGYTVAAVVLTWPLAATLSSRLGAPEGPGDPFLNLWILGWGLRAWTTDPASVVDGRVFDANIFHPAQGTLAYSDHMLLQSGALAPLYWATGDLVLCYNVLLLISIAASGLAMHVAAQALTGSRGAAWVAGLAWACWPYRTAHLIHIQLQALYFMPLALLALHRVIATRRWREAAGLGTLAALQIISSAYYGLMTALVLLIAAIVLTATTGGLGRRGVWSRLAGAGVLALVMAIPVLIPYARSQQSEGFGRTLFEAANHSASLQSYTQVPPVNLVYGASGRLAPRAPAPGARDRQSVEHQLFPGLVLTGLALVGLAAGWRSDVRGVVRVGAALVAAGLLLSFGPEGWRTLYGWLHDHVYGFQAIRAPARFAVIACLGAALLAGHGVNVLLSMPARITHSGGARTRNAWVLGAILLTLSLEYANRPLTLADAPPRSTAVGAWLARAPGPGAVLYLPLDSDATNTAFMVQSLEHARPIVNGYSGQRPAFYSALVEAIASLPSAGAWAALREVDIRFVVSAEPVAGAGLAGSPLIERARLADGLVYEVIWTPEALAGLSAQEPTAGPPGAPTFLDGERLVYDVYWETGPLDIVAGTATLHATRADGAGERWRFEVRADTADWVSRFFQAHDRFETRADAALQPLTHVREIREGRRAIDRAFVYDAAAGHVRVGPTLEAARAPDALSLPLQRGARDAVTALYYLRTLPLAAGAGLVLPINEAGTGLVLDVRAMGTETIVHGGAAVRALRLEPRLMRRVGRRRPVQLTVWLADDAGRAPLRVVVEAGFGRVRAERRP